MHVMVIIDERYVELRQQVRRNFINPVHIFMSCFATFNATHKQLIYLASPKAGDFPDINFYRQKRIFGKVEKISSSFLPRKNLLF